MARAERMFFRSQIFTVRSSLPDTTLSALANTVLVTALKTGKGGITVAVVGNRGGGLE